MGKFREAVFDELSLYVRQCAWLNATQEPADPKSKTAGVSRREELGENNVDLPDMPQCDAVYMVEYLFEIGPTDCTGVGHSPITHTEIRAWMGNTGIDLDSWEARALRRLSMDYLNESRLAKKRDCPAPFQPGDMVQIKRDLVSRQVKNLMQSKLSTKEK